MRLAAARLGVRGEPVRGERVGDGTERGLHRAVALGGVHARRELTPVLEAHFVGERLGLLGPERVERAGEQAAEQVVVLEGEREGGVERTGAVALRRTTGGTSAAVVGCTGDLDDEVAAARELLEVVAGDVGVQLEVLGDLGRGDAVGGVAHEEVDLAPGGITERVRDRADDGVNSSGLSASSTATAGILPIARSGNPPNPGAR